jgi:hypothetical protein
MQVPAVPALQLGLGCPVNLLLKAQLLVPAPTPISAAAIKCASLLGDVRAEGASRKRRRAATIVKLENGYAPLSDDEEFVPSKNAARGPNADVGAGTVARLAANLEASPVKKKTGRPRKVPVGDLDGKAVEGVSGEIQGEGQHVGVADVPLGTGDLQNVHWQWEWEKMTQEEWEAGFEVPIEIEQSSLVESA